jgi:sugar lactone lactonase YvrE
MPRLQTVLLATCIGLQSAPALAQDAPHPAQQTIAAVKRMLQQRPVDPALHFYLAFGYAQAGERDNALASLREVLALGDGFLPAAGFGFDSLKDDPGYKALRAEMEAKLPVVASAPVAFRIADQTFAPEGIAYDPASRQFFVGSVTQKRIVRISPEGKLTPFSDSKDGLQQILGLAVDAKRRTLYAVSTNALTRGSPLHNAVMAFDIGSGKRTAAYHVPDARQLNDVAIAPNGDLYASDSASGAIWRVVAGQVSAFIPPGAMGGSNGLVVSPDGRALYVAHSTGVARVDTSTAKVERLVPPARQTIGAIDGLYFWNGDLVGIQNITNPGRVIRIRLDQAGTSIAGVDTLQSHHNAAFDQPTTGAIAGKSIYVLGTTQLPEYNDKGEIISARALKKPTVVKVPLELLSKATDAG